MKKMIQALLPIWLVVSLLGCSSKQKSLFESSSCALPCWNRIIVGETASESAFEIISNLDIVERDSVSSTGARGIYSDSITFTIGPERPPGYHRARVVIEFIDNKAAVIRFNGDLSMTLQQIIELLGEPETVYLGRSQNNDIWIHFVSPSGGMAFGYQIGHEEEPDEEIQPENSIRSLIVFNPDLYQEIGAPEFLFAYQYDLKSYQWTGYGRLSEKYPP